MDIKSKYSNITPTIENKMGKNLHLQKNHPLWIIKEKIYQILQESSTISYQIHEDFSPEVSLVDNFDLLLIPKDHPSRSKSDTYYVDEKTVLRTHTSAHQNMLLQKGETSFLVTGDVYRKDEIDSHHFPVFHQMEGVKLFPTTEEAEADLIKTLDNLMEKLFLGCEYRKRDDYFPFTLPSWEYDVKWKDDWLEVLRCGVVHPKILAAQGIEGSGWAFGLGLERLAMILFSIPDIRYFWSTHSRFLDQFADGKIKTFIPYSKLPNQSNDISFWIPEADLKKEGKVWTKENDFMDIVRSQGGDWIAEVKLFDSFYHPKKKRYSRAYRMTFSPIDPGLKDPAEFTEKILEIYHSTVKQVAESNVLGVESRS